METWVWIVIAIVGLAITDMIVRMARFALIAALIALLWITNPTCYAAIEMWLR